MMNFMRKSLMTLILMLNFKGRKRSVRRFKER